ncbi:MAG: uroporphyrinogen-III synthase [Gammaproteobacteria bacterium]|nr:uroporphyrinogen-III synthase [Rhodocyclaceae bacterium]MBU3910580.1 uroporphyrinogen-III synthase [Gammaproteobacteria bacterium]MBU3989239.1 uroporphyrinogen-III synthase [Gammaproteobacteria bacterium]MBU4005061.1 uroporphyrinogen-III synthase [Gammaproteobacteria bacterium]MBU4020654.1 uroporphyrinogen-III synthase [Gammaproteobacteria bacterium]
MDAAASTVVAGTLAGKNIVVTRPAGQATHLAEALIERGAHPVLFPVLAIEEIEDTAPLQDAAIRLEQYDWAVFVSPNAVERALAVVLAHRRWPDGVRVATVGHSSEQALARHGIGEVVAPQERFDSEALLELPPFADMTSQRVIIFRGDGGRDLFGDTLKARGAVVDYVVCYRRAKPALDPAPLLKLWGDGQLDALTVTSSEGLRNLYEMVGKLGQSWLKKTPTFVPHARIAEQARVLGLTQVILTGPADAGLLAGLIEHFS